MQTFLPFESFYDSLNCLDLRRLGKQRLEAYQLIKIIEQLQSTNFLGRGKIGYGNHPATVMWENNLDALKVYYNTSLMVFAEKGGNSIKLQPINLPQNSKFYLKMPWFIGIEEFHISHRSRLIQKDSEFYTPLFPESTPKNLGYLWPKIVQGKQKLLLV